MIQNSKFTKITIAGVAENNSKIKTQNSKFKKDSFCITNVALLPPKRSPFTIQKDPFLSAKGLLLKIRRISPPSHLFIYTEQK